MVTAAAAMLYSYYEDISLADVKEILLSSTRFLETLDGNTLTSGMLDLGAAMTYDVDSLTRTVWTPVVVDTGTPPAIAFEQIVQQGKSVLIVSVTDMDADLTATAYAAGALDTTYFQNGSVGKAFSLDKNRQAVFTVSSSGTYSFYARDSFGNETVESVTVEYEEPDMEYAQPVSSKCPVTPGFQSGGWNIPTGWFFRGWTRGM